MTDEPISNRMVGDRRMQCKDIPDDVFLDAVRFTPTYGGNLDPSAWRLRWNVQERLESVLGPIPENLFLAKARKLMAAGRLGGCPCGCRGDYHLPCGQPYCCETVEETT